MHNLGNELAGGKEYGSARETDARGAEHHAEENDQVPLSSIRE
jgi:hypothetical protein